jgi:hypothetical protein
MSTRVDSTFSASEGTLAGDILMACNDRIRVRDHHWDYGLS